MNDNLVIARKAFHSRIIVGTGRHRSNEEMVASIEASGAEIITVAIRRLDLDHPDKKTILDYIDWSRYTILPKHGRRQDPRGSLTTRAWPGLWDSPIG